MIAASAYVNRKRHVPMAAETVTLAECLRPVPMGLKQCTLDALVHDAEVHAELPILEVSVRSHGANVHPTSVTFVPPRHCGRTATADVTAGESYVKASAFIVPATQLMVRLMEPGDR